MKLLKKTTTAETKQNTPGCTFVPGVPREKESKNEWGTQKKVLNAGNHQGNANPSHNETARHTHRVG